MDRLAQQKVALSLPSMRADTLTPEIMEQIRRVRRTGLTLAPEAGSQRLRQVINKNLTEETIIGSARQAFEAGWQLLKLYFMLGLPQETPADREAIAALVQQIFKAAPRGRRPKLNVSLSSFIPKAHTPFQWERQEGLEESRRRLHEVKDRLRGKNLQPKWNSAAQTWLEGVFSRGDRRLAPVLLEAHRRGCRLDAWSEQLRLGPWLEAFKNAGVDPDFYLRARDFEEVLPWDHLDSGVSRAYLAQERDLAYGGLETPDCRQAGCQDCGVCDQDRIVLRLHDSWEAVPSPSQSPSPTSQPPARYRLTFARLQEARWLSHLELVSAIYRSLRRSGLPLAFSSGFHPLPRVSFHGALPVGMESLGETLDVELAREVGEAAIMDGLNRALPPGLKILAVVRLPGRQAPPRFQGAVYQVESEEPVFETAAADRFLARATFPVIRQRPRDTREVDLRPLVAKLMVTDPRHLELHLRIQERDNLKATAALAAVFSLTDRQAGSLRILKLRSF
jgi:radical SAM-linked protein